MGDEYDVMVEWLSLLIRNYQLTAKVHELKKRLEARPLATTSEVMKIICDTIRDTVLPSIGNDAHNLEIRSRLRNAILSRLEVVERSSAEPEADDES